MTAATFTDPALIWRHSADPAEMVEIAGGWDKLSKDGVARWVDECRKQHNVILEGESGIIINFWTSHQPDQLRNAIEWVRKNSLLGSFSSRASLFRCCLGNPLVEREMVECPECVKAIRSLEEGGFVVQFDCRKCKNARRIPAPPIDPRWLTTSVIDLAREIKGGSRTISYEEFDGISTMGVYDSPCPERLPMLADALMSAYCDDEDLIHHLRNDQTHCAPVCKRVEVILEAVK